MTSVGSGSLMIVMLLLLYPKLGSREMVGTDLVQAIPLVGAAALGHLLFGHFQLDLTTSVLVGAIPGVYIGARISAKASDRYIRPALAARVDGVGAETAQRLEQLVGRGDGRDRGRVGGLLRRHCVLGAQGPDSGRSGRGCRGYFLILGSNWYTPTICALIATGGCTHRSPTAAAKD